MPLQQEPGPPAGWDVRLVGRWAILNGFAGSAGVGGALGATRLVVGQVDGAPVARWWRVVLGLGVLGGVAQFVLPRDARVAVYFAVGITAVAAIEVGARLYRPARPRAWRLLAAGVALYVTGDAVGLALGWPEGAGRIPAADAFYLASYAAVPVSLLWLSRGLGGGPDALLDAAIVTTGVGLVAWVAVVEPFAGDAALSAFGRIAVAGFVFANAALLAIGAWLVLAPGPRPPARFLLGLGVVAHLVSDAFFTALVPDQGYVAGHPLDAGWVVMFGAYGAAALHPSMRSLALPRRPAGPSRRAPLTGRRAALLAGAVLLAPLTVLARWFWSEPVPPPVVLAGGAALLLLAQLRLRGRAAAVYDAAGVGLAGIAVFLVAIRLRLFDRFLGVVQGPRYDEWRLGELLVAIAVLPLALAVFAWRRYQELRREVVRRRLLEAELAHRAFHDGLTGLANRAAFVARLERELAGTAAWPGTLSVLFLDLDGFKVINDGLGHAAGDRVLVEVGRRLRARLDAGDAVARLGGDEFTVLLPPAAGSGGRDALPVAERLAEALRAPIALDGREVMAAASIGIARNETGAETAEDLLRRADVAMYAAKRSGRARWALFDPAMEAGARARLELEADLRRALKEGELRLLYQPVVRLATGRMDEVEALVRWQHPVRGLLGADAFVPLAEETGLIVPLGAWVLEEACAQAARWRRDAVAAPPIVGVNLSAREFARPTLAADVADVLGRTGLAPGLLRLEASERSTTEDAEGTAGTLRRLRELGVRLAIDDFGTGYSGLSALKRYPVDTLKIDRGFVAGLGRQPDDTAIVRAVIALAEALGLSVTAEGVETAEQAAALRALRCARGQGHLFARPLPAEAIGAILADPTRRLAGAEGTPSLAPRV